MGKKADLRKFKKGLKNWQKNKKPPAIASGFVLCWRKPIFPGRHQPSIFGAGELNFRVRDGNGWTLAAINTNCVCCLTGQLNYNTTLFQKMQAPICIFLKVFFERESLSCPGHRPGKGTPAENYQRGPHTDLPHQTWERSSLRDLSRPGHRACAACPARVTGQGREPPQKTINAGRVPTSPTKLGSEAPCATCPARVTGPARLVPPGSPGTGHKKTTRICEWFHLCWRKPIFPGRHQPSIFGAGELNFRVRDGNGWTLAAINTNCVCCLTGQLNYNTTLFQKMQAPICIFLKKFLEKGKGHLARATSRGRKRLQKTINAGPAPPSPTKLGSEAPCATCPARVTGPPGTKKQPSYWTTALSVGENLFFRAVTSQVSSAPASLTSVFGMGTGGPSRQSTPTCVCRLSRRLSNNTTPFQEMQALFLKKLKKVFISPKTDGKRLTSRPNQPAAWRPAPSGAGPGTASPGNAPGLPYPSGR